MKAISLIEGSYVYFNEEVNVMSFRGRGRILTDGVGSDHGDKWHQNTTAYPGLNSDTTPIMVLPMKLFRSVKPIVLGSQGYVHFNGCIFGCVVGDKGPDGRLGEISWYLAKLLGIPNDPNTGGIDLPLLDFQIFCGKPAVINGKQYNLIPS